MSQFTIEDLSIIGADLLDDPESFMQDLSADELAGIAGGVNPMMTPPVPAPTVRDTVTPNQSTSSLACDCTGMIPVTVPTSEQPTYGQQPPVPSHPPRRHRRHHKWFSAI